MSYVVQGFSEDAKKAIVENPEYFVWWYTAKSIGLCAALAYIAFMAGRSKRSK